MKINGIIGKIKRLFTGYSQVSEDPPVKVCECPYDKDHWALKIQYGYCPRCGARVKVCECPYDKDHWALKIQYGYCPRCGARN